MNTVTVKGLKNNNGFLSIVCTVAYQYITQKKTVKNKQGSTLLSKVSQNRHQHDYKAYAGELKKKAVCKGFVNQKKNHSNINKISGIIVTIS